MTWGKNVTFEDTVWAEKKILRLSEWNLSLLASQSCGESLALCFVILVCLSATLKKKKSEMPSYHRSFPKEPLTWLSAGKSAVVMGSC